MKLVRINFATVRNQRSEKREGRASGKDAQYAIRDQRREKREQVGRMPTQRGVPEKRDAGSAWPIQLS